MSQNGNDAYQSLMVWKKVEEYLRLFETYGGDWFSLFLMKRLRKLACFLGQMGLRMKFIAPKLLIAQNSAWRHLKEEN